jgi:uncharacterized protein
VRGEAVVIGTDVDLVCILTDYEPFLVSAREKFALDVHGIHGEEHWLKVTANARRIVRADGGDLLVATLFGIFHDCCRKSDGYDHNHGKRAAEYVQTLDLGLDEKQKRLLFLAISKHNDGLVSGEPTIGACWDADRLDLPRVGTEVDPEYLSTDEGRKILEEQ